MDCIIINKITVGQLTMFAQAFAMIADQNNNGFFFESIGFQPLRKAANLLIHEGNFSIVKADRRGIIVPGKIRFRRLVWEMRIIKMNPGKKRLPLILFEPAQSRVNHLITRPLNQAKVKLLVFF